MCLYVADGTIASGWVGLVMGGRYGWFREMASMMPTLRGGWENALRSLTRADTADRHAVAFIIAVDAELAMKIVL